jgi:hypothetical protein
VADPLAQPEDLATFLGFKFDVADDVRAEAILKMASGEVRDYLGLPITLTTVTDEIVRPEPVRRRLILLRNRPVQRDSVTVKIDGTEFGDYDLDHRSGEIWRVDGSRWPLPWKQETTVDYTHGFDQIPEGIQDVVLQRAAILWVNPEANMQRRRGDASTAFASSADEATGLTKSMREALDRAMARPQ